MAAQARIQCRIAANPVSLSLCKEVLKTNPLAVEFALALLAMGAQMADLTAFSIPKWLLNVYDAVYNAVWPSGAGGIAKVKAQLHLFPDNLTLLIHLAECFVSRGMLTEASEVFERIRLLEPANVRAMDSYAAVLKAIGQPTRLNQLAHDLLGLNPQRGEPWIASALFLVMKGQAEKAFEFTERAAALSPLHPPVYLLKGNIALADMLFAEALESFLMAYALRKSLEIFEGLVFCYLGMGRVKDALVIAREALHMAPRNARALTLVGKVLSCSVDSREKANRAFKNALSVDPLCQDAVAGLSDLLVLEGKVNDALSLLTTHVQQKSSEQLHLKLAQVLIKVGNHAEALGHYHAALSMNPNSAEAKAGLLKVDRLIKGRQGTPDRSQDDEGSEDITGGNN